MARSDTCVGIESSLECGFVLIQGKDQQWHGSGYVFQVR